MPCDISVVKSGHIVLHSGLTNAQCTWAHCLLIAFTTGFTLFHDNIMTEPAHLLHLGLSHTWLDHKWSWCGCKQAFCWHVQPSPSKSYLRLPWSQLLFFCPADHCVCPIENWGCLQFLSNIFHRNFCCGTGTFFVADIQTWINCRQKFF